MAAAELSKLVETVLAAAKRAEGGDAAEQASVLLLPARSCQRQSAGCHMARTAPACHTA